MEVGGDTELLSSNIIALHLPSITEYHELRDQQRRDGFGSEDEDYDGDDAIADSILGGAAANGEDMDTSAGDKRTGSRRSVLKRHMRFPDLTNTDVKNMAVFFDIDTNPNSLANMEEYFGNGGGVDDGSSLEGRFISGPSFVKTLAYRLNMMMRQHVDVGTEMTFARQLFDEFPTLYRPTSTDYLVWIKYFLDWISILNDIPNLTELLAIPRTIVIQSASEAFKKLMQQRHRGGGGAFDDDDDYDDEDEEGYDVFGVSIKNVYPAFKKSSTVCAVLTMIEVLNNKQGMTGMNIDHVLNSVRSKLITASHRLAVMQTIDLINMHLQNFDLIDMDDTVQFLDEVTQLALDSNVVFPVPFCTMDHIQRENRQFFKFDLIKLFNNFNIDPKDFYSIHYTSLTNYTTIHSIMKAHALTSTKALAVLQDMTRMRPTQRHNAFQPDLTLFRQMLSVIRTGVYPYYTTDKSRFVSRTMSVKKRYTCLLLAQTFAELRFNAFLHYNRFDVKENAFLWHSLFHRLPNLFELLCREICRGNMDLAVVPVELLYDLDDKCNGYLSNFKQYSFASIDSPDSVLLPEVARPVNMVAMYVDILIKYRLLDMSSVNVLNSYYDRVLLAKNPKIDRGIDDAASAMLKKFEYDVSTEAALSMEERRVRRQKRLELTWDNRHITSLEKFRELTWTPMFPNVIRNRIVPGTCGRRLPGGGDGDEAMVIIGSGDTPHTISDAVIKWSRRNHETSGVEYTCLYMDRAEKEEYDERIHAFKMRKAFAVPPGGSNRDIAVNLLCDDWNPVSKSAAAQQDAGGLAHPPMGSSHMSEYANIVLANPVDNDIIASTLTSTGSATVAAIVSGDSSSRSSSRSRIGYPGGVDLHNEPQFDVMHYLDGYMDAIQVMKFDDAGSKQDAMNENIIKIAVQNAINAERKRITDMKMCGGGGGGKATVGEEDDGLVVRDELKNVISHYGYANKHQIMTIEAIFRYLYVHRKSLDLLKFGISQGIHPIAMHQMCSTRDAAYGKGDDIVLDPTMSASVAQSIPETEKYFARGSEYTSDPTVTVNSRRLLTGWLRHTNTLKKAEIYADITQSFMAVFQIGVENLKFQMNVANCSIIDFITYVFNFALVTYAARGAAIAEEQQRRRDERRSKYMTVGESLQASADSLILFNEGGTAGGATGGVNTMSWADESRPSIMMRFTSMFYERILHTHSGRIYYNDRTFFNDHVEMDLTSGQYMNTLRAQLDAVSIRNRRYMERGVHENQRRDVVCEILEQLEYRKINNGAMVRGGTWGSDICILNHSAAYILRNRTANHTYGINLYAPPSGSNNVLGEQERKGQYSLGHTDRVIDLERDICALRVSRPMNWSQYEVDYVFDMIQELISSHLFASKSQKYPSQLYSINNNTKQVEVNLYTDVSDTHLYNTALTRYNTIARYDRERLGVEKAKLRVQLARTTNAIDKGMIRERLGEIDEMLDNYNRLAAYNKRAGGSANGDNLLDMLSTGRGYTFSTAADIMDIFTNIEANSDGMYGLPENMDETSPYSTDFPAVNRSMSIFTPEEYKHVVAR